MKKLKLITITAFCLCLLCACNNKTTEAAATEVTVTNPNEFEKHTVHRVIDGDTFTIIEDNQEIYVRLIGVDTPESVAPEEYLKETNKENTWGGEIASEFTKELIENKDVYLEWDVQKTDKYGRYLCYVYLENGEMLQKILLENGIAKLATYPPNIKYVDEFKEVGGH